MTTIFSALNQANVRYLLCGGLAVNIFGIPRMTADIDIILDFEEVNLRLFHQQMSRLHYTSNIPIPIIQLAKKEKRDELLNSKNLIAYSYFNTQSNQALLDVLVQVPIDFDALWENKDVREVSSCNINIVSIQDLIKLKQYANRIQDQEDILLLSKIMSNGKHH